MAQDVTQYLDREGSSLAYRVLGDGPADVLVLFELNGHLDLIWSDPHFHEVLQTVTSYIRMATFQMRGVGLSESIGYIPTVEQQASDALAVMDAAGMSRPVVVGMFGMCAAATMVAAQAPHRVKELVFINPFIQGLNPDSPPVGWTDEQAAAFDRGYTEAVERWGTGLTADMWDTALATPYNRRLIGLNERCSASPAVARAYMTWLMQTDVTEICRAVQAPTRVLVKRTSTIPFDATRHLVDLMPHATLHEMAPTPLGASFGLAYAPMIDHIMEATIGSILPTEANRLVRSVLFTDIVSSTDLLADLGDATYGELRAAHERLVRLHVEAEDGELVNVIGDGTYSVFAGPVQALRAAIHIREAVADLGLQIRAGVHTGEVERSGTDFHGMTVNVGARISAKAGADEILVSRTVRDLVGASGLEFASVGAHSLKGVPGEWELYTLGSAGEQARTVPIQRSGATMLDRATLQAARRMPQMNRAMMRIGNAWQRRKATVAT